MGSLGLERSYAMVVGTVLIVLGLAGSIGNPVVGRPDTTGVFVSQPTRSAGRHSPQPSDSTVRSAPRRVIV